MILGRTLGKSFFRFEDNSIELTRARIKASDFFDSSLTLLFFSSSSNAINDSITGCVWVFRTI